MSEQIAEEAEQFKKVFPSIDKVYRFFSPNNWGYICSNKRELPKKPCITLNYVDALYNVNGAAKWLVKTQFTGLYTLSMSKEPFTEDTAKVTADLFLSRYGSQCNLYMLILYFGSYIMDYKSSYSSFDVQDILSSFGRKFLSNWNSLSDDVREVKKEVNSKGPAGTNALLLWLDDALQKGEDVRKGGLYRLGIITDSMIMEAEAKIKVF